MVAILAENLTKSYNGHLALDTLNLKVDAGDIYCLLGQNGAGKTTTINLFLGFTQPSSGHAYILGQPLGKPIEQKVSYIPEVVQLYSLLTGLENLDFFSRLAGFKYDSDKLSMFLQQAGLQPEAHTKRIGVYSKGMRQKVGIAIALASQAKVIFMDEPTSGLDPKATAEFTLLTKKLAEDGHTILMATHDIFNAVQIGNRIGIMNRGKLIHELHSHDITADRLQQLYLETV
jgi:ABC-2 type transport system ATP-binding protein